MLGEVAPQGGSHEGLQHLVVGQEVVDLLAGHEQDLDVLGGFEGLIGNALHPLGQKAVGDVVADAGILADGHDLAPSAATVASLLEQFAPCALLGRLALLTNSSAQLDEHLVHGMPVLAYHDKHTVAGDGDNIDPVGVLEHIMLGVNHTTGQLHTVDSRREPGPLNDVATIEGFPLLDHPE